MPDREAALGVLRDHVARAATDPALILDDAAARAAAALLESPDPAGDLTTAHALGWYHWLRFLALGDTRVPSDLDPVIRFLTPVFRADPERVPEEVRAVLAGHLAKSPPAPQPAAGAQGPVELRRRAMGLIDAYQRTRRRQALDEAIALLRRALDATPPDRPERAGRLTDLGTALGMLFEDTGETDHLREAVAASREAVSLSRPADPGRRHHLTNLAVSLRHLYHRTDDTAVLDEAVRTAQETVALTPPGHPGQAAELASLVHLLDIQSARRGRTQGGEGAVGAAREAVARTSPQDPRRAGLLDVLGSALEAEYRHTGRIGALEEAAEAVREAASLTPQGHPGRLRYLINLETSLRALYRRTGRPELLEEAVRYGREAASATPSDSPHRLRVVTNLGASLLELYVASKRLALLEEAAVIGREAVAATPPDHPRRIAQLEHLGLVLGFLAERTREVDVLEEAVRTMRETVAAMPRDDRRRVASVRLFHDHLRLLFAATDRVDVLEEALQFLGEATAAATPDDPARGAGLDELTIGLQTLFERTGRPELLEQAVRTGREALAAVPDDEIHRSARLTNLGGALAGLYEQTGRPDLLREAIEAEREGLVLMPPGHPKRALHLLNLENALLRLYVRTAQPTVLEEAVRIGREAVADAPVGHPERPQALTTLGGALGLLHERTGETGPLEEAVRAEREAVELTPRDHPQRAMYLNNVGSALHRLYERTGRPADLEEAVRTAREAVALTPDDHPARAGRLRNLAGILGVLHDHTRQIDALLEALRISRQALEITPEDRPEYAGQLNSLAATLVTTFKKARSTFKEPGSVSIDEVAHFENPFAGPIGWLLQSRELMDPRILDEAAQAAREAVRATPVDHPERAVYLVNLGTALQARSDHDGHGELLDEARRCYREAGESTAASTFLRIDAHRRLARLSAEPEHAAEGLRAVEKAIELVGILAPGSLTRADREHQIGRVADLAGEAAAAALFAGRPARAVELLERVRGILAADALAVPGDDRARLDEHAPHLAVELDRLRARLATPDRPTSPYGRRPVAGATAEQVPDAGRRLAADRREAYEAWQGLLTRIRSVPGCEDFLEAPSVRLLSRQAQEGPVVFVTTSRSRCDALILRDRGNREPVEVVPLTGLTHDDAYAWANRLLTARRRATDPALDPMNRIKAQRDVLAVLELLWTAVAEPVLERLGHTAAPRSGEAWPRVWWCPVGILAFLPLHAAGRTTADGTGGDTTLMDRVVSSYTTTVRVLAHARARRSTAVEDGTLIVPVPDVPDMPLPGIADEISAITGMVPDARVLTDATRAGVLEALPRHGTAHFACHGYADPDDPARSHLVLTDRAEAPLTIADISALQLSASLSYLSACDTGVSPSRLADESLHITGAFQIAGYQHVIGTLWSVDDRAAAELAAEFYAHLTADGTTAPRTGLSAHALHHAVRRMRARYPYSPGLWAAHTHTGS
ncbi:CHAT domain-containing protein [Streptomyces sp. NPDC058290]|uniref:CHAT domain-containing protein n=1 Tax=Streptomyces sp. NPDC058290 TaxID=3346426 RepID=UPI0036EB2538